MTTFFCNFFFADRKEGLMHSASISVKLTALSMSNFLKKSNNLFQHFFFVEVSLLGRVVALIPVAWRILDLCLWLSEKETALKAS